MINILRRLQKRNFSSVLIVLFKLYYCFHHNSPRVPRKIKKSLQNSNLKIQMDKSEFRHKQVAYQGHKITSRGVVPNPDKVEAANSFQFRTRQKIQNLKI